MYTHTPPLPLAEAVVVLTAVPIIEATAVPAGKLDKSDTAYAEAEYPDKSDTVSVRPHAGWQIPRSQ